MKRNIWIPKMTISRLERILSKNIERLTDDDKEDLLDFKYFLLHQRNCAKEKGLLISYLQDGKPALVLKNKFWLTNIESLTEDFKSSYYIN